MGMRGNFAELERLILKFERLSKGDFVKTVLPKIGQDAVELVEDGIRSQSDPYTIPWPTKKDGTSALIGLIGSFSHHESGRRMTLESSDEHAGYHQTGTKKIPKRVMVPVKSRGFPTKWAVKFTKTIRETFEKSFK